MPNVHTACLRTCILKKEGKTREQLSTSVKRVYVEERKQLSTLMKRVWKEEREQVQRERKVGLRKKTKVI